MVEQNRFESVVAILRGTVLAMPFIQSWETGLTPSEVEAAASVNKIIAYVVKMYGGAARWVQMCNGGKLDPALWPLGFPAYSDVFPIAPAAKPDEPRVLPPSAGSFTPTMGEPAYVRRIEETLDVILAQVSK